MILLTGANGQLGHDFQRLFNNDGISYIATDFKELDITNIEAVRKFVQEFTNEKTITLIINCAAYNNVDLAEKEADLCFALNSDAPRDLAIVAKEIGADYVTYSTDFVFDGKKGSPYTEEDEASPLSVYSQAKLSGEKAVMQAYDKSFVIRTSWVFGIANNNFNKQVLNWASTKDSLSIVDDQTSSPTYSADLAFYSWKLIQTRQYGLYHLSNAGIASKYDQAKYLLEKTNWKGSLQRAKSSDFPLPAARGEFTKLDSSKLEKTIGCVLPTWQSGIDRFLQEL